MKSLFLTIFVISSLSLSAGIPNEIYLNIGYKGDLDNLIEKKKEVAYSYQLNDNDPIKVENHFGDVIVKIWNKNEIKVNILITANAPSEEKVDAFLSIVDIATTRSNGSINFITKLNCLASSFKNNINSGPGQNELNFLKVDYHIYMPEGHDLSVNNSHGDIYIPEFHSVLNIKQEYGTLFADHLKNENSNIDVNFGKAFIKSMTGGKLSATQTSLLIDKVENVQMTNTFGSSKVLEANNSTIKTTYTKAYIGKVKESCKFKIAYSKEFTLGEILANVKELEIESSHTNLELPLCIKGKFDLRVAGENSNIQLDNEPSVRYITTSNSNQKRYLIGENNAGQVTKVMLLTNYGRVRVK